MRCGKERMEEVFWPCPPVFTLQADVWLGSPPCRDGEACCASWERAAWPCCFPTLAEVSRGGEVKPRPSLACGMCLWPLACLTTALAVCLQPLPASQEAPAPSPALLALGFKKWLELPSSFCAFPPPSGSLFSYKRHH